MMSDRYTGADVEALATLAAAGCYIDADEAPESYRDELVAETEARLACSEVMRELINSSGQWDSYNGCGRLVWQPAEGVIATLDTRHDVLSVRPEGRRGRIVSMDMDTTTMAAREVVETAARMAKMIKEDVA